MRLIAVHTCPLVEVDGERHIIPITGYPAADPDVVGWVNVLELELYGERHELLYAGQERT
jgi:hypothetical protein